MNLPINAQMIVRHCLLLVLCFFPIIIQAQTVDEFIQMAQSSNPGLDALQKEYLAAQYWADQKDDYPDPRLSLGVGVFPIETRLGAQRLRIGVSQSIPWKGLLQARAELATAKAKTLETMADSRLISIEYAIRNAYAELIMINAQIDIIQEKLDVLRTLEELAKSTIRSGNGKLSDLLLIERNKESLTADLEILNQKKKIPTININRWAGRPLTDNINIVSDLPAVSATIEPSDLQSHPDVEKLIRMRQVSAKTIDLISYERKPSVGVGLEYAMISGRSDAEIENNGRDVLMPVGSLTIPLNRSRYTAKVQEEKLNLSVIDLKIEDLNQQFAAEITTARSMLEMADMQINKFQDLKNITTETLRLMRTEYASEGTRFQELIRVELELIDYDEGIVQANYLKNTAIATLEKYR